jgi:hypothetical protein
MEQSKTHCLSSQDLAAPSDFQCPGWDSNPHGVALRRF